MSQIHKILEGESFRLLHQRYADVPHRYLGQALQMRGESDPQRLEAFMDSAEEILSRFDTIEESLADSFGSGWVSIARLAYNLAVVDFARRIPAYKHVALLYERRSSKDEIIRAFLEPSVAGRESVGTISIAPTRNETPNSMLYGELLEVEKSQAMNYLQVWIGRVHSTNNSTQATRILGEEDTWFIENGFVEEILSVERRMGHALRDNMTVLCAYNIPKLKPEYLKQIIISHSHVILADAKMIYVAPDQA